MTPAPDVCAPAPMPPPPGAAAPRRRRNHGIDVRDPRLVAFWTERHLTTLTTLRADGTPHVVPVGATLDPEAGLARVITSRSSRKARHVAGGDALVAICQIDARRWSTIEGRARLLEEPADVSDAETRYATRYRVPRPNPERVVIAVQITRILGTL